MATTDFYVGEVGKRLRITVKVAGQPEDLSQATHMTILLKKKDATVVQIPADLSTNGLDGKVEHVWRPGELDQPGEWKVEFFYVTGEGTSGSGKYYSSIPSIVIADPLEQVVVE